jgi:hypothetical protein
MFTVITHVTHGLQSELQIMYKCFTTHCYTVLSPSQTLQFMHV